MTSTQGDGEPPEEAVAFYKYLHSSKRPDLSGTAYAVFSLGDSSYEKFCQAGIDFDTQLRKAGATELVPRADADVDYQPAAAAWTDALTQVLKERGLRREIHRRLPLRQSVSLKTVTAKTHR